MAFLLQRNTPAASCIYPPSKEGEGATFKAKKVERIADPSGWLLIVLMTVTCVDVVFRKFGVVGFPYTRFQELEWHLHTAIFSTWLGYNYVVNAHPRVDSYTDLLGFRRKAWIELAGCLLFALPYTLVLVWYGWDFVKTAYVFNEVSDSAMGLPYRWVIKGIMYIVLWLPRIAGLLE